MPLYTRSSLKFAFSKELDDIDSKKYGIIGVPFDSTSTYKAGARWGPMAVREASYNFEKYNLRLNKNIYPHIYDFGDVEVIHGNFRKTCSNIEFTVSELLETDITPVVIGGEHTISYAVLKELGIDNTTIIHFDAHMDLRDNYMGEKFSHATVTKRIFDLNPKNIIQVGVRSSSEDEIDFAKKNDIRFFTSYEVNESPQKVKNTLKSIKGPVYVSIDIDILDPAFAPSVATPSPCGLNPFQLEDMINSIKGKDVIGMDLVEVSSTQFGDITSINGAKAIYDFLCLQ